MDPNQRDPSDLSPFDLACIEAVRLLTAQQEQLEQLSPEDEQALATAWADVSETLPRLLSRRALGQPRDLQEVASEALTRFVGAIRKRQVSVEGSPSGYLLRIAANVVRDRHRRAPLPMPAETYILDAYLDPVDDREGLAQLLDEMASLDEIRAAVARAGAAGDRTVLEVVETWLNLAADVDRDPTVREVASVLGIGKSTVANALIRFRGFVQP